MSRVLALASDYCLHLDQSRSSRATLAPGLTTERPLLTTGLQETSRWFLGTLPLRI